MALKNPNRLFPLFLTEKLEETKRYYTETLGFRLSYDSGPYIQVACSDDEEGPELCFMKPDAFPDGAARPAFAGQGVIVSVPTPSADTKYKALKRAGAELIGEPQDKPWGWRSFFAVDPNGILLDFFHVYKEVDLNDAAR